jgi:DNA-damage-inducible protein J
MPSVTVQSRVNPELKQQAEVIFASMGMSLADGIRIFLHQTVNVHGLPFQPSIKQPNAESLAKEAKRQSLLTAKAKDTENDTLNFIERTADLE